MTGRTATTGTAAIVTAGSTTAGSAAAGSTAAAIKTATIGTSALAATCALAGLLAGSATALAGPSMSTNWAATELDQRECLRRAERVVRDAGMNRNFEIVGQSVFGQRDAYTAVVRCITDKRFVYFVVAGPSLDETKSRMRDIFDKF